MAFTGFIIGLVVGGAAVTGLAYIAQQRTVGSRWPSWLLRIASYWRFD